MATQPKSARSRSLRKLLQESSPQVRYDATRGLARHERLVASAGPLPEWATGLKPSASPRGVSAFAKRAWWLGSALTVAGALWWGTHRVRQTEPAARDLAVHPEAPAAGPAPRAALEPLARPASPEGQSAAGQAPSAATAGTRAAVGPEERALVHEGRTNDALQEVNDARAATPPSGPRSDTVADARVSTAQRPVVPDSAAAGRAPTHARATDLRSPAAEPPKGPRTSTSAPEGSPRGGPKARSRASVESPRDAEEMRQLAEAERLLGPEPVRALRIVREGHVAFRSGYFAQERRYIEVMALFALGRHGEAHAHAAWFLRDFPNGPYQRRVETELLRFPVH